MARRSTRHGDSLVVVVPGDLTGPAVARLRTALDDAVRSSSYDVAVDLRAARHLGVAALEALEQCRRALAPSGRRLRLLHAGPRVRIVLAGAGVRQVFDVAAAPEPAAARLTA